MDVAKHIKENYRVGVKTFEDIVDVDNFYTIDIFSGEDQITLFFKSKETLISLINDLKNKMDKI